MLVELMMRGRINNLGEEFKRSIKQTAILKRCHSLKMASSRVSNQ